MDQRILSDALEALQQGQPINSILRCYPHHAEDLRPLLELAQELRATDGPPLPARWKAAEMQFLQAAAQRRATRQHPQHSRLFSGLFTTKPLAAVLTTIVLIVLLSMGTMVASARALPGNPLYSVKRAMEHVQISISSTQSRPALLMEHAEERRREIEALIQSGSTVPPSLVHDLTSQAEEARTLLAEQTDPQRDLWKDLQALSEHSLQTLDQLEQRGSVDSVALDEAKHRLDETANQARAAQELPRRSPVVPTDIPAATPGEPTPSPPVRADEPPGRKDSPGQAGNPPAGPRADERTEPPQATTVPPGQVKKEPGQSSAPGRTQQPGPPSTPPGQNKSRPANDTGEPARDKGNSSGNKDKESSPPGQDGKEKQPPGHAEDPPKGPPPGRDKGK
ncbi:MAG: hypothetical protein KatS3mg057_0511 [Herpetosiphonaceae bacterium]|nr:MAG: hypothetical protein KatS3mg057_0511 [Herpetosiphonaceae bacterium]